MATRIFPEKIVKTIDRCGLFFFAVLIFFLPISNAAIESCFGFIYLCFILRCIFKRPTLKTTKDFFRNRINLSLLIFYIIAGLSMLMSGPLIAKSFKAWFFKWGEGFLLFYFAQVFIKKEHIKPLLLVLLFSCLLVSVDGIYQKIVGVDFIQNFKLFKVNFSAPRATFPHYNDFATYLVVMAFLTFGFFSSQKKFILQLFLFLLFLFLLINLIFTFSRGAWVSLIVTSLFLTLFFRSKKATIFSLAILLLLVTGFIFLPAASRRFTTIFQSGGDADRFAIWKVAILMFKEYPLLGKGVGLFMDYMDSYQYRGMNGLGFASPLYAHNCYLQILAEMGMFGLLSFLWFLGELLIRGYKKLKESANFLFVGIYCSLVAFLTHAFFDTQFYSLKLSILFWILAAFLAVFTIKGFKKSNVF